MSEVLVPYTGFSAPELGGRLYDLVGNNRELLTARHLFGVMNRYGSDADLAVANVAKGQSDENPEHFAVVDRTGNVQGAASIFENLSLGKSWLPVPPGVAQRLRGCYTTYPYASHNIHAWTSSAAGVGLLEDAYAALTDKFRTRHQIGDSEIYAWHPDKRPWTLESEGVPGYIYGAIMKARLQPIAKGRFDDNESKRNTPRRSILFAHIQSVSDSTVRGKLKELRTGQKTLLTRIDEGIEEMSSRNPIGY